MFVSAYLLTSNRVLGFYFTNDPRYGVDPSIPVLSTVAYLIGGALSGFGATLGNGCHTGHGLCGLARLSKRSFVYVCIFMASSMALATLTAPDNQITAPYTGFLRMTDAPVIWNQDFGFKVTMIYVIPTIFALLKLFFFSSRTTAQETTPLVNKDGVSQEQPSTDQSNNSRKIFPALLTGCMFATGIALSGMVLPSTVLGFVNLTLIGQGTYDPTLFVVMGGGVLISFLSYQFVEDWGVMGNHSLSQSCPLMVNGEFSVPKNTTIDKHLFIGAITFGMGWGLGGTCPGQALYLAGTGMAPIVFYWWPAFFGGAFVARKFKA